MDNNEQILVDVEFEVDESFDSDKFLKLKLRVVHDGDTAHNMSFLKEALKDAEKSIYNSPILANVIFDKNNQPQFSTHDKHIEKDYAGNVRIIHDEVPIGLVTESSKYEIKKESDRNYVYAEAYIWKKYANYALDIINRDKNIKLSAEVSVLDFYTDKKTGRQVVKKFKFNGITLLGNHRNPGMKNAQASIDFDEIKVDRQEQMIALMDELKQCIHDYNNENGTEGGSEILENKETEVVETKEDETVENEQVDNAEFEDVDKDEKAKDGDKPVETEPTNEDADFELTQNETRNLICEAVRALKTINEDSYEYYWLDDYDSKYIYVNREYKENKVYKTEHYRYSYAIVGDKVTIGNDKIKTVRKILTVDEWNALEVEREKQSAEFDELKAFKIETIKAQRKEKLNALFDKFDESLKDVKDYIELKENNADFDLETIEEKCFALVGKIKLETSVEFDKEKDNDEVEVVVTGANTEFEDDTHDDYLGGYLNKYYNK